MSTGRSDHNMSDYDEELDNPEDEEGEPEDGSALVKRLRREVRDANRKAKTAAEAEARATTAERKLALMEAGIDLSTPTGRLFAKAYDGDISAEAIRAAAEEYELVKPAVPEVPAGEVAAQQRIAAASAGAPVDPDLDFNAELAKTSSPEEVMALAQKAGLRVKGLVQ